MSRFKLILILIVLFAFDVYAATSFQLGRQAYESGDYDKALGYFDQTIRRSRDKSEKNMAYYFQGLVLYELGHSYSAYVSFRNVLSTADRKNRKIYGKAIKNAVILTDRLNVVEVIGGALAKLPGNYVPNSVSDLNHYGQGKYYFMKNDVKRAAGHLKSVHPESAFYIKALFHLGILAVKRKDYKESIFYFAKILKLCEGKKELFPMAELARLNLARSVYAYGNVEKSIEIYSRFLSSSPHWLTVLFEASWPLMRVSDTTVSMGNLHTILSPFYREQLVGEAYILRATILYTLCKYEEMRTTLAQFFEIYDPVIRSMRAEAKAYSSSSAFFTAFTEKKLNRGFTNYAERDVGIKRDLAVLELLKKEKAELAKFSRNNQMRHMIGLIGKAEAKIGRKVGGILLSIHSRKLRELLEQREQANYLRVEIVTGEKDLIQAQRGLPPKRVVDVETSVAAGYRFWPYRGEYWEDELGAYVYTTESACVN